MLKSDGIPDIFPFYWNDETPLHEYNEAKELLGILNGGAYLWSCPLIFPSNEAESTSLILRFEFILKVCCQRLGNDNTNN